MVIAKTASRNVAFKSDKLMDALFQEGQSAPQTPQTLFDADFEGLASNAEVYIFNQDDNRFLILTSKAWPATRSCIFLIRMIVRNRLELILATSWFTQWYMLCKVITANTTS